MGPIYDEIIEAPLRVEVDKAGGLKEVDNLHVRVINSGSSNTIGAPVHNPPPRTSVNALFENAEATIGEEEDDNADSTRSTVTITAPVLI